MCLWDLQTYAHMGHTDVSSSYKFRQSVAAMVCAHESVDGLLTVGGAEGILKAWQVRRRSLSECEANV